MRIVVDVSPEDTIADLKEKIKEMDQYQYLGNCPPTSPQH